MIKNEFYCHIVYFNVVPGVNNFSYVRIITYTATTSASNAHENWKQHFYHKIYIKYYFNFFLWGRNFMFCWERTLHPTNIFRGRRVLLGTLFCSKNSHPTNICRVGDFFFCCWEPTLLFKTK